MFREGEDMFQLYGLFNLFLSVAGAALLIYILYYIRKRRKKEQNKN